MHRREVLLQLSATGILAGLPGSSMNRGSVAQRDAFAFLTDQPQWRPPAGDAFLVLIPATTFLSSSWHVGLRCRSLHAVLGAANALLLMESLRDVRAEVHLAERVGDVEVIIATLPVARRRPLGQA